MEVFRLSRRKYAAPLSGKGAAITGARWNSTGVELIYTASNRSLAMAEVAVHLTLATLPKDYVMAAINVPNGVSVGKLRESDLPLNWNVFPYPASTQAIGDKFVAAGRYCILQAPSSVTYGDYNFLINPQHGDFRDITIIRMEKFPFDKRIFK